MLIKCPECGKEISDKAPQCIHCGFPLDEMKEDEKPKSLDDNSTTNETKKGHSVERDNKSVAKNISSVISENKTKTYTVDAKEKATVTTNNQNKANKNDTESTKQYDIILKSYDLRNKKKIIREVELLTGKEYEESKAIVESLPFTIARNLSTKDCKIIKKRFTGLSASVAIVPSKEPKAAPNELDYLKKLSIYHSKGHKNNTNSVTTHDLPVETKQKKKGYTNIVVFIFLICVLIVGIGFIFNNMKTEQAYNYAVEMLKSDSEDDIEKAIEQFSLVIDKKGDDIQEVCKQYIYELCNKKEYDKAIDDLYRFSSARLVSNRDDIENYINYQRAETLLSDGNIIEAYNQFIDLGDYKDSSSRVDSVVENNKGVFYDYAVARYENGNYENAYYVFAMIGDYKDSEIYLSKIDIQENITGTYKDNSTRIIVISDDYVLFYKRLPTTRYNKYDAYVTEIDGKACLYLDSIDVGIYISDNKVLLCRVVQGKNGKQKLEYSYTLTYISDNTSPLTPPQIGMTSDEVRYSTWGEPKTINRSEYSWGTSEQWCYDGYKYVYLDNGVVTAIQD